MLGQTQVAHVELRTPVLHESLAFFRELLAMQVSDQTGDSVYLRGYEEGYHHSLKLTAADQPGLGHIGLRVPSSEHLDRLAASPDLQAECTWTDGDVGHGRALRIVSPSGHVFEVFHDIDYWVAAESERTVLLNRPQRRPLNGVPVHRIDHVNVMVGDVAGMREWLMRFFSLDLRELATDADGREIGAWLTASSLMHDLAITLDESSIPGRLHHVAFFYGVPQHLWDIADHLVDHGIHIEHGPGKHGVSQAMYMYVIEPGGNRIELFGEAGQLVFDPTWRPVVWVDNTMRSNWIGNVPPASFRTYATPPLPGEAMPGARERASAGLLP